MPRFAVIGLGRFGGRLARSLAAAGAEVLAIDKNRQLIEDIQDDVTLAVRLDSTDENALLAQGVDKVDVAVVSIGEDFESAVLTTVLLKAIGVRKVVTRAQTEVRGQILRRVGADEIVYPEGESAVRWAHRLMLPRLEKYIELGEDYSLIQIPVPRSFVGGTPASLHLRQRYGVTLVAICRDAQTQAKEPGAAVKCGEFTIPMPDTVMQEGDQVILIGGNEALSNLPTEH